MVRPYHARWHKTFLGVRQQHCYGLYEMIDYMLLENSQIRKFVELGTGGGALSVVLGLHAFQRGTYLLTFDVLERKHLSKVKPIFEVLGVKMKLIDCLSGEAFDLIKEYIEEAPCFFFCDGGDKPKEFNTFSGILPKGSVIAAHDYNREIFLEDIQETVNALNLTPLYQEEWVGGVYDIRTCFYKV